MLRSGEPRIIEWDPWPETSGYRNVLAYAVANGLVAEEDVPSVSQRLAESYRLVRWNVPGPQRFGGARFLVHRSIPLDGRGHGPERAADRSSDRLIVTWCGGDRSHGLPRPSWRAG
jgi:hypothetical protein